jgi:hypothetical protein
MDVGNKIDEQAFYQSIEDLQIRLRPNERLLLRKAFDPNETGMFNLTPIIKGG